MKTIIAIAFLIAAVSSFSNLPQAQPTQPQLLAYWSFDSVSGNTFSDATGHGYNASFTGSGVSAASGISGQALRCIGTGYEMTVANSRDSFSLNKLTIEAWYNTDTAAGAYLLDYQYVTSGVYNGYGLFTTDYGQAEFALSNSTRTSWITALSTTQIAPRTWYYLVATYDSAALKVYVNGNCESTVSYSGGIGYPVAANARIACQTLQGGSVRLFDKGRIDELKIFTYALSADTIRAHYQAHKPAVPVLIPCTPNPTYGRIPVFRWFSDARIAVFRIQIDTLNAFRNPIVSERSSDTTYSPPFALPLGTNYWRVSNDADTSAWSAISSLTILASSLARQGTTAKADSPISLFSKLSGRRLTLAYYMDTPGNVRIEFFSLTGQESGHFVKAM